MDPAKAQQETGGGNPWNPSTAEAAIWKETGRSLKSLENSLGTYSGESTGPYIQTPGW